MKNEIEVPVEVSARHMHITQRDLNHLFSENGKDYSLKLKKALSQPGQFLAEEKLILRHKNSGRELKNVSILGPPRSETQIELAITDLKNLGFPIHLAKIKESGDLRDVVHDEIELVNEANGKSLVLKNNLIVAKNHLHVSTEQAKQIEKKSGRKLDNGDLVDIKVKTDFRSVTFNNVVVRKGEKYNLAFHLDTDEGNAAGLVTGLAKGYITN